jgi:phosphatidylglycerophosphate synthase
MPAFDHRPAFRVVITQKPVVRFYLLAPALALTVTFVVAFLVYAGLCAAGRAPAVRAVKHNELFGPFFASFLVWVIQPFERLLVGRVSPNVVTFASLALCGVTGFAAALGHLAGAVWLYVFAGILDVLDGRLARQSGRQTSAGALVDSVADRWGELFAFAGYAWFLHDSPWLLAVFAALGGSTMVSYTRARAEGLGLSVRGGLMQRAERIVLVAGGTLLAAWYGVDDMATATTILGATMLLCGVASTGTAIGRWITAYRQLVAREAAAPAGARAPKPLAPAPARAVEQH